MKCPSCQQEPITFRRWLLLFDPVRILCMHCAAKLKLAPKWRTRYHLISIFVAALIIAPTILSFFDVIPFGSPNETLLYAGILIVFSLIGLAAFFWKRFEYIQEQE